MLLLTNGIIATMDASRPLAEAAVVDQGHFAYVGSSSNAADFAARFAQGPCETVDLGGRFLLPGFNDSHLHFIHYVKTKLSVDLFGTTSLADLQQRLRRGLERFDPSSGRWLLGEGWNQEQFTDVRRFPTCQDLDQVSTQVPILIMRSCFHVGAMNSKAMALLGIDRTTVERYGVFAERDADGAPNGVVKENVLDDIKASLPSVGLGELLEQTVAAQQDLFALGLTSIQSDDFKYAPEEKPYEMIAGLADGSLGARTAFLQAPYADQPDQTGLPIYADQAELDHLVLTAHRRNMPVAVHAIGDGGAEMVLQAVARARAEIPWLHPRHGLVHCQIMTPDQLERMKQLDMTAFIQPVFINGDMHIAPARLGPDRLKHSYSWGDMAKLEIPMAFGTDCPVEHLQPLEGIYCAVTRRDFQGAGPFLPEQALTPWQALYGYTAGSAYASGEEHIKGQIRPGYLADFVIMDRDLLHCPPEELLSTQVLRTYVDGQCVYRHPSF